MVARGDKRGTGMTERVVPTIEIGDGMSTQDRRDTLRYAHERATRSFAACIKEVEQEARARLTEAGHNPAPDTFARAAQHRLRREAAKQFFDEIKEGGSLTADIFKQLKQASPRLGKTVADAFGNSDIRAFQDQLRDAPQSIEAVVSRLAAAHGLEPPGDDSQLDYAHRILRLLRFARARSVKRDEAMYWAFQIGMLVAESDMKTEHEPTWETGRKQRRALEESRVKMNAKRHCSAKAEHDNWQQAGSTIWDREPDLSRPAVARRVKETLGLKETEKTISRKIKKPGRAG